MLDSFLLINKGQSQLTLYGLHAWFQNQGQSTEGWGPGFQFFFIY